MASELTLSQRSTISRRCCCFVAILVPLSCSSSSSFVTALSHIICSGGCSTAVHWLVIVPPLGGGVCCCGPTTSLIVLILLLLLIIYEILMLFVLSTDTSSTTVMLWLTWPCFACFLLSTSNSIEILLLILFTVVSSPDLSPPSSDPDQNRVHAARYWKDVEEETSQVGIIIGAGMHALLIAHLCIHSHINYGIITDAGFGQQSRHHSQRFADARPKLFDQSEYRIRSPGDHKQDYHHTNHHRDL